MGKLLFCSEGSDFEKINSLVTGFSVSSSGKGESDSIRPIKNCASPLRIAIRVGMISQ